MMMDRDFAACCCPGASTHDQPQPGIAQLEVEAIPGARTGWGRQFYRCSICGLVVLLWTTKNERNLEPSQPAPEWREIEPVRTRTTGVRVARRFTRTG